MEASSHAHSHSAVIDFLLRQMHFYNFVRTGGRPVQCCHTEDMSYLPRIARRTIPERTFAAHLIVRENNDSQTRLALIAYQKQTIHALVAITGIAKH